MTPRPLPGRSPREERGPRAVGDLIGRLKSQVGLGRSAAALERLEAAWVEAVGRRSAQGARLRSFRGGTLTVDVDSAALAHELGVYHRRALLARLRERSGLPVTELRLRVVGEASPEPEKGPAGTENLA